MSRVSSELFMYSVYDKAAAYVDKTAMDFFDWGLPPEDILKVSEGATRPGVDAAEAISRGVEKGKETVHNAGKKVAETAHKVKEAPGKAAAAVKGKVSGVFGRMKGPIGKVAKYAIPATVTLGGLYLLGKGVGAYLDYRKPTRIEFTNLPANWNRSVTDSPYFHPALGATLGGLTGAGLGYVHGDGKGAILGGLVGAGLGGTGGYLGDQWLREKMASR